MPDTDFTPALAAAAEDRKAQARMVDGYNLLRGALDWFNAHEVEIQLGHIPQWVTMARELLKRR
jgi:hypothetical protein